MLVWHVRVKHDNCSHTYVFETKEAAWECYTMAVHFGFQASAEQVLRVKEVAK